MEKKMKTGILWALCFAAMTTLLTGCAMLSGQKADTTPFTVPSESDLISEPYWATVSPKDIEKAIKHGADFSVRGEFGRTTLMLAAMHSKSPAVLERLIKNGADIEATNEFGKTALMLGAMFSETPSVLEALIKHGAKMDTRDNDGMTAADHAAENPYLKDTPLCQTLKQGVAAAKP